MTEDILDQLFTYRQPAQPFAVRTFDLTSARTGNAPADLVEIPANCRFIQAICDGGMDGISIRLQDQSNYSISLKDLNGIASGGATRLFLTNDIRSGRSTLTLLFHFILPGQRNLAGNDISRAEQAVRDGSIDTFDRRGEVIFQSNFNKHGLIPFSAGDGTKELSNAYSLAGELSVKLTTGATAGNSATLVKNLAVSSTCRFGAECSFQVTDTNLRRMYLIFQYFSGAKLYYSGFAYNYADATLEYLSGAAPYSWTAFESSVTALWLNAGMFNVLKFVIDFSNSKHVRGIVNNGERNISAYPVFEVVGASAPRLVALAGIDTNAAAAITGYVDRFIITQNEP